MNSIFEWISMRRDYVQKRISSDYNKCFSMQKKKTTFQVHFQNRNRFVRKRSLFIICIAVHYVHCALAMYSAKYNIVESSTIMFLTIVQWFTTNLKTSYYF